MQVQYVLRLVELQDAARIPRREFALLALLLDKVGALQHEVTKSAIFKLNLESEATLVAMRQAVKMFFTFNLDADGEAKLDQLETVLRAGKVHSDDVDGALASLRVCAGNTGLAGLPDYLTHLPFRSHPTDLLWIGLATLTISFLATLYPASRAAAMDPVEALRYE